MRKYAGKLGILLIGALMAALPVGPAFAAKKVALVVGNANYAEAPLRNPVNDARAIARQLRGKGFEVLLRENVTKAQFSEAVADFGERISAGDTALFFYAGHGLQVQGRNYLVPIDARITSEQRVRLEAMDVEAVLDQTTAAKAKVSLVILDACRNNPFERRFRSTGGGLAQINAPEGTLIAYATAPGKVAADGEGSNGLYTQALLSALAEPGLKVEEVFKNVRIEVARVSGGAQIPWEASSLTGDFFFVPPVEQTAVREAMFWDSVKGSTDPAELNAYLTLYPNGHFAPIARARIAAVEAARALATAEAERNRQAADAARQAAEAARAREVQETARASGEAEWAQRVVDEFRASSARQVASTVAASAVPRAFAPINGTFVTLVGAAVFGNVPIQSFFTVEDGVFRLTASSHQTNGVQSVRCLGVGVIGIDRSIAPIEVQCSTHADGVSSITASGRVVETGGRPRIEVELVTARGRKHEVVFR
ncbi:MAG: caspase family protein [Azospirillum sp.]|nr:caspase family protein [Azospirillum sp.]